MQPCPSTFALDLRESQGAPADDSIAQHVAACPRCHARATARAALDQRFASRYREPLWRRVQATSGRRRRWRFALLAPAPALLLAALVLWLRPGTSSGPVEPGDPAAAYRGAKGGPAVPQTGDARPARIDVRRAGRVFAFDDDAVARPGDEIQLTLADGAPEQRYVLIGSVDGTGRFSPFYPGARDGQSVAVPPSGRPLLPPIVLDAAPGPERIAIVRSSRPLPVAVVAPLAEAAAVARRSFVVQGADDARVDVRWVTLRKQPDLQQRDQAP